MPFWFRYRAALFLFLVQNYSSFFHREGRCVKTSSTLTTNRHVLYQISLFLRKIPLKTALFPISGHGFWTIKQKKLQFFLRKITPIRTLCWQKSLKMGATARQKFCAETAQISPKRKVLGRCRGRCRGRCEFQRRGKSFRFHFLFR